MVRQIMLQELANEEAASTSTSTTSSSSTSTSTMSSPIGRCTLSNHSGPVVVHNDLKFSDDTYLDWGYGISVDHTVPGQIVRTLCPAGSSHDPNGFAPSVPSNETVSELLKSNTLDQQRQLDIANSRLQTQATLDVLQQSAGPDSDFDSASIAAAMDVDMDSIDPGMQQAIENSLLPQSATHSSDSALSHSVESSASSSSRRPAIQPPTNSSPAKATHANAKQQASGASQRKKHDRQRAKKLFDILRKVVATQVDDNGDDKGKAADDDNIATNWSPPDGVDDDDVTPEEAAAVSATVTDQDMQRFGAEVAEVLRSAKRPTFYRDALALMHRLIIRLRDLGGDPVALAPLYHASAGYITIGTQGLYFLLKDLAKTSDIKCPETSVTNFKQHRLQRWPENITIPRKLFLQPDEAVLGEKKYFRHSFTTDGVGASVGTRRWVSRPNAPVVRETIERRATRLANAAAEAARAAAVTAMGWTTEHFDREFVGVDPGRKTTIEARRLRDPNWSYTLSTNEYYERCGMNDDRDTDARETQDVNGLKQWMSKVPTAKTATAQETLKRLRYLYQSPYFRQMMDKNLDVKKRIRRWESFKRKQSFIAKVCHRLTEGLEKHKATICFGDAGFSNSSRGNRASISMQPFFDFLRREGWHVVEVSEFNTSQVCSYCCRQFKDDYLPYKVCDVGGAADGHAFYYKPASNHFVRRCTHCHAILNRDGNAARSIGYLGMLEYYKRQRPLCFTKHLQKPPAYDARRLVAQAAQAAERAAAAFDTETPTAPVALVAPVAPVAPADDAEVSLSNSKQRRVERRVTRKMDAKHGRERHAQEVADILASPNEYVQRLVMARPTLDPEAEWTQVYERVTKGQKKWEGKKAASDMAKTKTKRTADSSTTEEPAPKRRRVKTTTAPKKKAKTTTATTTTTPKEPVPEEPASKQSKTKKDKNKKKD
ncbi:hypothetical protein GGI13_001503 [Coemansia sp. RSA 455]|nr:hypothetical protein GGI13_001503 [Coemansia sp. RSA 455]